MRYCVLFLCYFLAQHLNAQTLHIQISGLRNNLGQVQIQFFTSKESFDEEIPAFSKLAPKAALVKGILNVTYTNIPSGTYGVAILDDENSNKKMDYGLLLPKEGFGFSDYYHRGMSRPDYNKFKFTLGKELKSVQIKVRYM